MNRRHAIKGMAVGLVTGLVSACSGCGGPDATGTAEAPPKGGGPSQSPSQGSPEGGNVPRPSR